MNRNRTIFGFLIAPIVFPIAVFVAVVLSGSKEDSIDGAISFAGLFAVFTYGIALILGIPLHFLMRRKGWLDLEQYAAGGAVLGLSQLLFWGMFGGVTLPFLIFSVLAGASSAALFWFIAIRPRVM